MSDIPRSSGALFLLGASHHTAPLELRERLATKKAKRKMPSE